ncbi:2OG-Fe(II) oxygenase [Achromobacter xylosoxidans]
MPEQIAPGRLSALRHAADDAAFPFGLIALLSETGQDFTGGEFVMTEQRPRQQSRPMVLPLQRATPP